jgi:hypothetical protein
MNDVDHIPLSIDFKSSLYWLVSDCWYVSSLQR